MKKTFVAIAATIFLIAACTTTQQQTAFNTIYSVEQTGTAAANSYFALVVAGKVPTNDVPNVARAFNTLQAGIVLAAAASKAGTNALAPASLQLELSQLLNLISTATGGH